MDWPPASDFILLCPWLVRTGRGSVWGIDIRRPIERFHYDDNVTIDFYRRRYANVVHAVVHCVCVCRKCIQAATVIDVNKRSNKKITLKT